MMDNKTMMMMMLMMPRRCCRTLFSLLLILLAPAAKANNNMNGAPGQYKIANSETYVTDYHYGDKKKNLEYFDVYSEPIATLYGQVHWRAHKTAKLPDDIIQRFENKVMAIVGYEVDQVRVINDRNDDENNNNDNENNNIENENKEKTETETETPVPITWAYNHHYGAFLLNSRTARLVPKKNKVTTTPAAAEMATAPTALNRHDTGHTTHLVAEFINENNNKDDTIDNHHNHHHQDFDDYTYDFDFFPQVHFFSEGNGGEMRLSHHGYPAGYAQLLDSPDSFQVTPMQIDTWNRANMTTATYVPGGPLPKSSSSSRIIIPAAAADDDDNSSSAAAAAAAAAAAGYSRLIECPCSNRLEKKWGMTYKLLERNSTTSTCASSSSTSSTTTSPVQNATECFAAAQTLVAASHYTHRIIASTLDDHDHDHDDDDDDGDDLMMFPPGCSIRVRRNGNALVVWNHHINNATTTQNQQDHVEDDSKDDDSNTNNNNVIVAFSTGQINLTVTLSAQHDEVQMMLVGPDHVGNDDDVWFAVGFGTNSMCLERHADECPTGGPYAILVQGDLVTERKLDYHGPGIVLNSTITVQSNTLQMNDDNGGSSRRRTVVLTRSLKGANDKYYTFDYTPTTTIVDVPVIMAKGCGPEFAQHCGHGPSQLNFLHVNQPTSICQAGIQASIDGDVFALNRCAPFPTSDLLHQSNPTCNVQSYTGGLSCCRDGKSLLDKEQEQPWPDTYLRYRLKFRFYFEEYQPATPPTMMLPSHESLVRLYWQTESFAGEYDISPCPPGTPPSQCVQVITSQWKVRDMMRDCVMKDASWCTGKGSTDSDTTAGVKLIYAAPHCHAPTCLSMELYNADTGQLICRVEPIVGKNSSSPYEEEHFLAIPPCLWGDEAQGLMAPTLLSLDTSLLSIKRNNNTLPHTGEMASWQMRGVVIPQHPSSSSSVVTNGATSSRRFDHATVIDDGDIDEATATQLRRVVNHDAK